MKSGDAFPSKRPRSSLRFLWLLLSVVFTGVPGGNASQPAGAPSVGPERDFTFSGGRYRIVEEVVSDLRLIDYRDRSLAILGRAATRRDAEALCDRTKAAYEEKLHFLGRQATYAILVRPVKKAASAGCAIYLRALRGGKIVYRRYRARLDVKIGKSEALYRVAQGLKSEAMAKFFQEEPGAIYFSDEFSTVNTIAAHIPAINVLTDTDSRRRFKMELLFLL